MAAMRARRPGRGDGRGARRSSHAPSFESVPRLARIKLSGGLGPSDVHVNGKSLAYAITGVVLFFGAAAVGATWLGSSLFDANEAVTRSSDAAAARIGFAIGEIKVEQMPDTAPITEARASEVRRLVTPEGRHSILALDPDVVKAQVEALDWVASARVRRLWPATVIIEVERRQEYAIWDDGETVSVIDANGERLSTEAAADHPELIRVVGADAGPASPPLLAALEGLPNLRARIVHIARVNDRRWNLKLRSGAVVALPENGAPEALARLEQLHIAYALLDRPVTRLDMRAPGRLAVRVRPALEGGPFVAGGA
ncbi:MAG: cell division protein FtsQ/DivIB [Hyphomonadaceae bacterium]|nr:cell division protein FtsQ/DivIB [Hyphomonadaceae bacterium]